jgi:predicted secreted protein
MEVAMVATGALLGYGTRFQIEDDNSPAAFIDVAEVFNVAPPNPQTDTVEATHNLSPDRTREYIAGLIEPGEASFEMNFIPGSTADARIQALRASGVAKNCRVIFPNNTTWTFLGIVTGFEPATPVDDRMTATVTLKVSGSTTITIVT